MRRLFAASVLKAFVTSGDGMETRVMLQPWGFVAAAVASRWDVRWSVSTPSQREAPPRRAAMMLQFLAALRIASFFSSNVQSGSHVNRCLHVASASLSSTHWAVKLYKYKQILHNSLGIHRLLICMLQLDLICCFVHEVS